MFDGLIDSAWVKFIVFKLSKQQRAIQTFRVDSEGGQVVEFRVNVDHSRFAAGLSDNQQVLFFIHFTDDLQHFLTRVDVRHLQIDQLFTFFDDLEIGKVVHYHPLHARIVKEVARGVVQNAIRQLIGDISAAIHISKLLNDSIPIRK